MPQLTYTLTFLADFCTFLGDLQTFLLNKLRSNANFFQLVKKEVGFTLLGALYLLATSCLLYHIMKEVKHM